MLFRENDKIVSYEPQATNKEAVERIIRDLIEREDYTCISKKNWHCNENQTSYRSQPEIGLSEIEFRTASTQSRCVYQKIVPAPFTIALASRSLGPDVQNIKCWLDADKKYIIASSSPKYSGLLSKLFTSPKSNRSFFRMIDSFDGDTSALLLYLQVTQPCILSLQELLEHIELMKVDEFDIEQLEMKLSNAKLYYNDEEERAIEEKLQAAQSNSSITKLLNLEFQKRRK